MDITFPVYHLSRGSFLHQNERAASHASRVKDRAWDARSEAYRVATAVKDCTDKPEWDTKGAAAMREARATLVDALAVLDGAMAAYDALPVASEYLEAAE